MFNTLNFLLISDSDAILQKTRIRIRSTALVLTAQYGLVIAKWGLTTFQTE